MLNTRAWLKAVISPKSEQKDTTGYRVYTTGFDSVVHVDQLDHVLGPLNGKQKAEFEAAREVYENGTSAWRMSADIAALGAADRIRAVATKAELKDTAISILVDHSGSMRGQKILLTAVAVDILFALLTSLGVKTEILAFTTSSWQGGQSRRMWVLSGKPKTPGRLCDLLHIVYKSFDGDANRSHRDFTAMLRPNLLKENVDGEAIQWASDRLKARPEAKKILLLISDGAPVDDSTLAASGVDYLYSHYKAVIAETAKQLCLAMLMIGEELPILFERQRTILTPGDLGISLISLIEETIVAK